MALALSPQPRTAVSPLTAKPSRPAQPTSPVLRLSVDCRTRRNRDVRARYEADMRARRRQVFIRRRIVASVLGLMIAVAACLGVRALASRGDGAATLPTVTPRGSAVLFTTGAIDMSPVESVDVSGAFIQGQQVYVVQPGDTLWSIASSLTDGSIRSYVSELIELNGSASIDVGQRLVLPAT